MKWPLKVGLAAGLLLALLLLLMLVPGGYHIRRALFNAGWVLLNPAGLLLLFAGIFVGPMAIGGVFRLFGIGLLDIQDQPEEELESGWHWIFAGIFGVIVGVAMTVLVPILLDLPTWLKPVFDPVGLGGPFETPPFGWAIYGCIASMVGYWFASTVEDE